MIDVDSMQELIRVANPVPSSDQLDPDELARFVALSEPTRSSDVVEAEPVRWRAKRQGTLVAVASAAVALGAVAIIAVLVGSLGSDDGSRHEPAPPATGGQITTTRGVPSPALFDKRLIPVAGQNPPPLATAIGDLDLEVLEFESAAYSFDGVKWTPHGLVGMGNDRLYWSTDFYNWTSIGPFRGETITVVDDEVIVHGNGASMRYTWDGGAWVEDGLLHTEGANQVAFGESGAVTDSFLYSSDGVRFSPAEQAPSLDSAEAERRWCPEGWGPFITEPLVFATDAGYVALVPTYSAWWSEDPVCESVVWFSPDGNRWDLVSAESPFGEETAIYRVAERDGRFVAAGGAYLAPAVVWVSDNGIDWERIDLDLQTIDGLAAGNLGWVITGARADYEQQLIMFSADGRTWDGPYERPEMLNTGYLPPQIAVGDDAIFGIGGSGDVLIARLQE